MRSGMNTRAVTNMVAVVTGSALLVAALSSCDAKERGPSPDRTTATVGSARSCGQEAEIAPDTTLSAQDVWGATAGTVSKSQRYLLLQSDGCAGADRAADADCDSFPWVGRGVSDASVLYHRGARGWATADFQRAGSSQHLTEQVIIFDRKSGFAADFDQLSKTCGAEVLASVNDRPATVMTRSGGKTTVVAVGADRLVALETNDGKVSADALSKLVGTAESKAAGLHL